MPVGVMMQEPEKERSENTAAIPEGVESKVDIKHRFEEQEILRYFLHSADFRKAAMSGNYIYVDGFIVLNSPRCIHRMRSQPRVLPSISDIQNGIFARRSNVIPVRPSSNT